LKISSRRGSSSKTRAPSFHPYSWKREGGDWSEKKKKRRLLNFIALKV